MVWSQRKGMASRQLREEKRRGPKTLSFLEVSLDGIRSGGPRTG